MKKFFILIITFILLFSNSSINVNAVAGFSGNGSASGYSGSYSGSSSGECEGWRLNLSPIILFSLMDVSDENALMKINSYYMINTKGTYDDAFLSKSGYINGHESGKVVTLDGDIKPKQLPYIFNLQGDNNDGIIPNSSNVFLNFNVEKLRSAIIDVNSEDGITEIYRNIVIYMLEQEYGYEVANGYLTLEQINQNLYAKNGKGLGSYRVFIEPVYALQYQCSTKYSFMTTKAIASSIKSGENYKVYISSLYNNLYSDEVVSSLNKGGYISPVTENEYKNALANPNHGAGYAVVRLFYDIANTCIIEKDSDSGNFIYYDSNGNTWEDDEGGDNLNYFLTSGGCSCDDINNSEYKTEIINTEIKENVLKNNCSSDVCLYDEGSNTFYGKNSQVLGSYESFIQSCGCYDNNVLALKNLGGFSSSYATVCPSTTPTIKVSSNLKKCTVTENTEDYEIKYEDKKNINSYCNLKCVETINFNDVYGKYFVKAGKYFELGKYPTLTANKNCSVDVKYSDWYDDYEEIATAQANYISETNKYNAVMNAEPVPEQCYCDLSGCHYADLYKTSYTQYTYSGGNFNSISVPLSWGGCDNDSEPSIDSTANSKFGETIGKINALFNDLKYCSEYLAYLDGTEKISKITTEKEYYTFNNELKYYYYQDYSKSGRKRNDEKEKNIDDSELVSKSLASVQSGNYLEYTTNTKQYKYFNGINSIKNETVGKDNYNTITREVKLKFEYAPKEKKYVDIYTAEISKKASDLSNPLFIDNVYDIDITAKAKTDNENYFSFTALGDDNQIYKWFEANKEVEFYNGKRSAEKEDLNRHCTYEIINDLLETCEDSNCDSKLNVVYRSVDPKDIDPNNRLLEDNQGFSNWKNTKGQTIKAKIESDAKKDITYSPENLEYSFTLDSATIAAIRGYNKDQDNIYDKWNNDLYTCVNGNECISKFITQANSGTFKDENNKDVKQFAKDISGREKWKYMTYNSSTNEWSIENYDREEMTQTLFLEYKEKLGGLTP